MANETSYRFPPFPGPAAGVEIVPFSAFQPAGYVRATGPAGESIEVDAWAGIPTVKVRNEDEAAQNRKSKKKRRNAGNTTDGQGRLIPWWEEWEEGEASRAMSQTVLGHLSLGDRICLAADDFRVGRTWPELAHGVRLMWDQFRLYVGLVSSMPVYRKIKKQRGQVDGPSNVAEASDEEGDAPKVMHTRVDIVQDCYEQTPLPGKQLEPGPESSTAEAHRLQAFLGDMEKTVKVFLSSYMRDSGLIWTERNLTIAPIVLHFFLRFMFRNHVFSDSAQHLGNLERAIDVAALARQELPVTAKLGQILPGHFDIGCKECWGIQGSLSVQISATVSSLAIEDPPTNDTSPESNASSVFETELEKDNVEIVPSDVVLDSITARQVMEDSLDTDNDVPVTTIPVAGDPWTAAIHAEEYTMASWTDVSIPWLMQLLGPSVFPLKMTTGIVEFSTRRIREVVAPETNVDRIRTESVLEDVLREKFYRVVLCPWVRSASEETADFPKPVIVSGLRGAVIGAESSGAWDPFRDDVTVLVGDDVARYLLVGMGLCGTWVQITAVDDGRAKDSFWYTESLVASFPSFYTEGEIAGLETVEDEDD